MRKLYPLFAVAVSFTGLSLVAFAAEEVTIKGEAVCAKCALKEKKTCQNVVMVKEGDKEVKYYLAPNAVAKKAHQADGICQATKDAPVKVEVTGTVEEKEGRKVLTASKIEKE